MKIHLQQKAMLINGEAPKFALCGQMWPELTENRNEVTCNRCLRKINQLDRLIRSAKYSAPTRHAQWEGAEA